MAPRRRTRSELVRSLRRSPDPSIRWRTRVRILGEARSSPAIRRLEQEIRSSDRAARLLARGSERTQARCLSGVYHYWQGAHWALASLAEIGYPPEDPELRPFLDCELAMWTRPRYLRTRRAARLAPLAVLEAVPVLRGRARQCASIQGNALLSATALGAADPRAEMLARLLMGWQWPDGGWNCDKDLGADTSSFMETLLPMRALSAYAARTGDRSARRAASRAAEVFLQRHLFRRRRDGRIMRPRFLRLHYPTYWHYDVLAGLRGMLDVGRLNDPRCREALDWLEARELEEGGWPAEERYYRVRREFASNGEFVDWGAPDPRRRNDWVTTEALHVLRAAGRDPL
jgi:hypothetical protein